MWSPRVGHVPPRELPELTVEQPDAMVSYLRARGYREWDTYGGRAYRPRWLRIALEFERAGRGSA
jgi:hypothetical protein